MGMIRQMSVAGSFYPANSEEIKKYFTHFNTILEKNAIHPDAKSRAVIVPHAGYIYSGFTANLAYRVLKNSNITNYLVIGPSHRIGFDGISICDFKSYATPFAEVQSAHQLLNALKEKFQLPCIQEAHHEHSTEVQFPFIKHYLQGTNIVELVYSNSSADAIAEIIDYALQDESCGVIISTDLSHFHTLQDANGVDNICLNAIHNLDIAKLHSGCEACGILGVEAMLISAKRLNLSANILDYRTSADASQDKSRVVGYVSAYFS